MATTPRLESVWGAVVVGAGRGRRFGDPLPKQFHDLAGRPVMAWSLEAFLRTEEMAAVVPVVHPDDFGRLTAWRTELPAALAARLLDPVAGGERRQDSVRAGIEALPTGIELVGIHDAARPFITVGEIERVYRRAESEECGGALLALAATDSIKQAEAPPSQADEADKGARLVRSLDRSTIWRAQTPQVFPRALLIRALDALDSSGIEATDEAQAVEALGGSIIHLVEGSPRNLKITSRDDLEYARWLATHSSSGRP